MYPYSMFLAVKNKKTIKSSHLKMNIFYSRAVYCMGVFAQCHLIITERIISRKCLEKKGVTCRIATMMLC